MTVSRPSTGFGRTPCTPELPVLISIWRGDFAASLYVVSGQILPNSSLMLAQLLRGWAPLLPGFSSSLF